MDLPNNEQPIAAIQNVPAVIGLNGSLEQQIKASGNLDVTSMFFQMPYDPNNEIVQPLLFYTADHFRKNNICPENLPAALIVFMALNSVRWRHPLPIIIKSDDPQAIYHLLNTCKQIAPEGSFIEVQDLPWEQLYADKDKFRGKVIICTTPKGCKKALPDIRNLIVHGKTSRQVPHKSIVGKGFETCRIKYPIGFIGVETTDEKNVLDDPNILKILLSSDQDPENYAVISYDPFEQPAENQLREIDKIKTIFGRVTPCRVQIPFINQINSDFRRQRPTDLLIKLNSVLKILSLLSITNNPSPLMFDEILNDFMRSDSSRNNSIATKNAITTTKVEYAQMAQLLKDVMPIRDEHYTRIQIIIFKAVKKVNLGKLKSSTVDQKNKIQVLGTLYKSSIYWAKPEEIFERANSEGGKLIPIQVIDRELNKLNRLGMITKRKFPQNPDHGYYINDTSIGKHITFQSPSEINDPKFNMAPVKVVNPITGKIETI
ncbi:MAG: hypothetical protein ABIJ59_16395 [Pseudomonadota bacterium]